MTGFLLPPKVNDPSTGPLKYHAMDPLAVAERNREDERQIETMLLNGTPGGSLVFLEYDRAENLFKYVTGERWETPDRFVGQIPFALDEDNRNGETTSPEHY